METLNLNVKKSFHDTMGNQQPSILTNKIGSSSSGRVFLLEELTMLDDEGSTTIPTGSRGKCLEVQSSLDNSKDEDIVSSSVKAEGSLNKDPTWFSELKTKMFLS